MPWWGLTLIISGSVGLGVLICCLAMWAYFAKEMTKFW